MRINGKPKLTAHIIWLQQTTEPNQLNLAQLVNSLCDFFVAKLVKFYSKKKMVFVPKQMKKKHLQSIELFFT